MCRGKGYVRLEPEQSRGDSAGRRRNRASAVMCAERLSAVVFRVVVTERRDCRGDIRTTAASCVMGRDAKGTGCERIY